VLRHSHWPVEWVVCPFRDSLPGTVRLSSQDPVSGISDIDTDSSWQFKHTSRWFFSPIFSTFHSLFFIEQNRLSFLNYTAYLTIITYNNSIWRYWIILICKSQTRLLEAPPANKLPPPNVVEVGYLLLCPRVYVWLSARWLQQ